MDDKSLIDMDISIQETKHGSFPTNTFLGPDGFLAEWYKSHAEVLAPRQHPYMRILWKPPLCLSLCWVTSDFSAQIWKGPH